MEKVEKISYGVVMHVVKHESVVHETSASDESVYAVSASSVIVETSA